MDALVTGAASAVGLRLIEQLLKRDGRVVALVPAGTLFAPHDLRRRLGAGEDRLEILAADPALPLTSLGDPVLRALHGRPLQVFHLHGSDDPTLDEAALQSANVKSLRQAVGLAKEAGAARLHLLSSIAAAGRHRGDFTETMTAAAADLRDPLSRSRDAAESLLRGTSGLAWRIYRAGALMGDSSTGEIDRFDGPYAFFALVKRLQTVLPPWMPLVGVQGDYVNLVPVDFVAAALDHIAALPGLDGRCFHLVDPNPHRAGEILNLIAKAAGSPKFAYQIKTGLLDLVPGGIKAMGAAARPFAKSATKAALAGLGLPKEALRYINVPTRFDAAGAQAALAGSGIAVPPFGDYAGRLWAWWDAQSAAAA